MNRAYIFIGTNIDRRRNYIKALRRLAALGHLLRVSAVYETAPVGGQGDDFYNGAVLLETANDARRLKDALEEIEEEMGRVRSDDRNAPRTIDLDLVLYNEERIDDGRIRVPDPLIETRYFLAQALAEISPRYIHPESGRTLAEIAAQLEPGGEPMRVEPAMTARIKQFLNEIQTGETTHA